MNETIARRGAWLIAFLAAGCGAETTGDGSPSGPDAPGVVGMEAESVANNETTGDTNPPTPDGGPSRDTTPIETGGKPVGFTPVKPSADSKVVYVSSSTGNDSNDCLSETAPCKTIAAGLSRMRNGMPDHLLLKRGDTWKDQLLNQNVPSGRSASEPAVIAAYGSGPRPKLLVGSQSSFRGGQLRFLHVMGLELQAYKLDPTHPEFTGSGTANIVLLGAKENILFEDNKFHRIEIVIQLWEGGIPKNFTLRRNIFTGAYINTSSTSQDKRPSNIYVDGCDGLEIEENVFDHGGWHPTVSGAGANMYNHNLYIQHSNNGERVVLRRNIITRASSHGAQLRAGGLAEDNFFGRNAIGIVIGYGEKPLKTGVKAHMLRNVASEGHSMIKGKSPCSGNNLCTPAFWGIEFNLNGDADWEAKGNVAAMRAPGDTLWSTMYSGLNRIGIKNLNDARVDSANNISWKWSSDADGTDKTYPAPGRTLGDYNASLGGSNSFEEFMEVVLNRPPQLWDDRYSAPAINAYIRAGFGM